MADNEKTNPDVGTQHGVDGASDSTSVPRGLARMTPAQYGRYKSKLASGESAAAVRRWRERNPHKVRAQNVLNYAIKKGRIRRPDRCEFCGAACRVHGHHRNYAKPLDVVWLCPRCHKAGHSMFGRS